MKIGIRLWILLIVLALSILAIGPNFGEGIRVSYVDETSDFHAQGMRAGEVIQSINGQEVKTVEEYSSIVSSLVISPSGTKVEIVTDKSDYIVLTNKSLGMLVEKLPKTNIKTGLDISGGARALVKPDANLTDAQLQDLIAISSNRFNVYGLSDVQIRPASDLAGNKYMLIEIAGATPKDLEHLIAQQGKFEAKVGNNTVFEGGKSDISDVCRRAECSTITNCAPSPEGVSCSFVFTLYLTEEAAKRHATVTRSIPLDSANPGYLAEKLFLYVDDKEVDSLFISADLRGRETTQISIQGPGVGKTQEEALKDAKANMNELQTILLTGSLPYKLEIVKLDTISPNLNDSFVYTLLLAGTAALVAVSIIIFIRYRKFKLSLALLFTSFSEIIIILGFAALIRWNLDLPAIAGILATIGTGVDSQIVILDEAKRGTTNIKDKIKRALFVILASYATAVASLIPLWWAGAGLFKGFAITTLIGITAGVFISRPAFAEMIRKMENE